jgi:hypothetical protein
MMVKMGSIDSGFGYLCFGDVPRFLMLGSLLRVCAKHIGMGSFMQ